QRDDNVGYVAAQHGVGQLIAAVPALARWRLEGEQIAQLDSKDMSEAVWAQLARRIGQLQQRPDVAGIVVTHGTDTLEETAYALHRLVSGSRPVVLTAAMRPGSSL
ncbi:MAG: asparaginase, partial [Gemmatimonadetes bacterium]|nr:asparaginase [Gemmatimonadota bacterium]